MKTRILFFLILLASTRAYSADYPYENESDANSEKEESVDKENALPRESLANSTDKQKKIPNRSLQRIAIKFGANYAYFETPTTTANVATQGLGFDGLVSYGWDARFYPVFFEVESGYRRLFANDEEPYQGIPLGLGFYFRERLGLRSLLKIGFRSGLEFRYSALATTGGTIRFDWGIVPYWGVAAQFEFSSFLVEPFFYVGRFQSDGNFWSTGLRLGLRL